MAKVMANGSRRKIVRLIGGRVDIATGAILALLWQAKAAAAASFDGASADLANVPLPGEATLITAIARDANPSISLDELRALLTPEELARLGLDPDVFGGLLIADPKAAILKLDAAFKGKLKLAAATGPAKAVAAADASSADAHDIDIDGGGGGGGGGNGILYALGGLLGAGAVAGVALGGGGNSNAAAAPPTPANAAPVAVADTAATSEDTAVTFDVRSNDTDANGDPLNITAINGTAITTTTPVATTGGSISLGADGRLTFTPAANFNGPVSFSYTVSDGKGGTATATTTLTIAAVNDAPANAGAFEGIPATQATTVAISGLAIADIDAGTSVLTTTLAVTNGVLFAAPVTGGAAIAGGGSATLTLTGTLAQLNASLAAITYRGLDKFAGVDSLQMTTTDGVATDTDSFAITVAAVQSGVISDGYIAGGTVFIDVNGNGAFDPGEPTAQTDGAGHFSILFNAVGAIVAFGGINADTGLANLITMRAPAGSTVVNPLTTIIAQLVSNGMAVADANASVAAAFGLPVGTDFGSFDILAAGDHALGLAAQKAASEVATLLTLARQAADPGTGSGAEAAILSRIGALVLHGPVDLGDAAVLHALFTGVTGINADDVAALVVTAGTIIDNVAAATSLDALSAAMTGAPALNLVPVTSPDSTATTIGAAVTFNPVANDRDANGNPLAITAIGGTSITIGHPVAVEGGSVALNVDGSLTFTPAPAFVGSPHFVYTVSDGYGGNATGDITISVAPAGATVDVAPADIAAFADHAGTIAAAGITTLDIIDDTGSLSDTHASTLVNAGIEFAEADHITVEAHGTHLATSLNGLQHLNVDSVAAGIGVGGLSVDAGAAGLGGLSATGLPSFVAAQSDAALDVTLTLSAGAIEPSLDLANLAPALAAAGIDHLGVVGGGLSLTTTQAADLALAGIDFAPGADVTLVTQSQDIAGVIAHAGEAAAAGVDHIDMVGDAVTLADADAGALVQAGLDFAESDHVSVAAEGTHLATTLKGLQDLHVDNVALGAGIGMVSVNAGAGGFGGIAATGLPSFTALAGNPDITLNQAGGTLDAGVDLSLLAPSLAAAGIDHLGVAGNGELSVTLDQASALTGSGVDFAAASDITVRFAESDMATVASHADGLAAIHVDHLDVIGGAATISDSEAGHFIAAGLDFAQADDISVAAEGTHLSTTLKGLQDLHVDAVGVQQGVNMLYVAAGDLAAINADGLPHFGDANGALDVTLAVAATDLAELPRLAEALRAAGVDHIAIDTPIDSLGGDVSGMLAGITAATGIDFVELPGPAPAALFSTLLAELGSGDMSGQTVELNDSVVASIVQSGMIGAYLAENVTIDATGAGDKPLTSLKSIADLKVDAVHLADFHDTPVYIDLGIDANAVGELQSLFAALDPGTGYSKIFTGSDHVALVVDAHTADLLAGVDGALDHLAQLGFTEIDVLAGNTASLLAGDGTIEVKLIGQDDDLYDYLHHGRV